MSALPASKLNVLNYGNLLAYAFNILTTFLIGQTHLVGKTNSEVSETYPTLFTPAGWAFSIWGVIFLLEGAFSVYQLTPSARGSALVQKGIGPYWILMCLMQAGWSLSFALEAIPASMFFMLLILACLTSIGLGQKAQGPAPSLVSYVLLVLPFSINWGWITAATLANVNITALYSDSEDVSKLLAVATGSVMAVAVLATVVALLVQPGDSAYCLVLTWATAAVAQNLKNPPASISVWAPAFLTSALSQVAACVAVYAAVMAVVAMARRYTSKAGNAAASTGQMDAGSRGAAPHVSKKSD